MRKGKLDRQARIEVRIDKLVYGGWGLGRFEGRVVFVPFSAPGDLLAVRVTEERRGFLRARIEEILEPGPQRVTPECPHFGSCGACQWQHISYTCQLESKRAILEELFRHRFPETREMGIPMHPSPCAFGYRSRARIQMRGYGSGSSVGYYRSQSHHVEDIGSCPLLLPLLNAGLEELRHARKSAASDPGVCEMDIACDEEEGRWAASVADPSLIEDFSSGSTTDDKPEERLVRAAGPFRYETTPSVFFQANGRMTESLVTAVSHLAQAAGEGSALELYCGVGLFTLPLSRFFREVVAVESSRPACDLCRRNLSGAGADNVRVACSDVSEWMNAVGSVATPGYDLVLLDPPRSGAGAGVFDQICRWAPRHIVYVACDPQTLCRDLAGVPRADYAIRSVEGFDLFPQTFHFETIVHLQRLKT